MPPRHRLLAAALAAALLLPAACAAGNAQPPETAAVDPTPYRYLEQQYATAGFHVDPGTAELAGAAVVMDINLGCRDGRARQFTVETGPGTRLYIQIDAYPDRDTKVTTTHRFATQPPEDKVITLGLCG